jgi:AI-2 transport protein TqsA
MPLVVAVFVVSGVTPLLKMVELRLKVNRLVASAITFVAGLALLLVFGATIWFSLVDLSHNAESYRQRVQEIVDLAEQRAPYLLPAKPNTSDLNGTSEAVTSADPSEFVDVFVREGIKLLTQSLLSLVSASVVVLIYVFFLLAGTPVIDSAHTMVQEIDYQIRSYLSLKTVISGFTGLAFGIALYLFGVPMALTFGVLAFLLNFVPNIGPIVASLLPVPLIVLDPNGSIGWMVAAIFTGCAIQLISGNVVEPKLMGETSDMHPVTVLVALMFWGMMWGIVGMFLATPITGAIRILLHRIPMTRPVAELMAGRWSGVAADSVATKP